MLQERLQAEHRAAPHYEVIETLGPTHRRVFHVEVRWDQGSMRGQGRSIKIAEMEAARRALEDPSIKSTAQNDSLTTCQALLLLKRQ